MITDNEYIDMAYTVSYMHIFEDDSKNQIKAMLHFAELYHQSEVKKLNIHGVSVELPNRELDDIDKDYIGN
jgi:hypothetical protein